MTGPSLPLDPTIHAYRSDIADVALAGQLFAPHYARAMMRMCGPAPTAVLGTPAPDGPIVTNLAAGEEFAVLDITAGWAWGYRRTGHLVGYIDAAALEPLATP